MDVYVLFKVEADSWNPGAPSLLGIFDQEDKPEKWLEQSRFVHNNWPDGDERNFWWRRFRVDDPTWVSESPFKSGNYKPLYPNRVRDWRYFYVEKIEVQ